MKVQQLKQILMSDKLIRLWRESEKVRQTIYMRQQLRSANYSYNDLN